MRSYMRQISSLSRKAREAAPGIFSITPFSPLFYTSLRFLSATNIHRKLSRGLATCFVPSRATSTLYYSIGLDTFILVKDETL